MVDYINRRYVVCDTDAIPKNTHEDPPKTSVEISVFYKEDSVYEIWKLVNRYFLGVEIEKGNSI